MIRIESHNVSPNKLRAFPIYVDHQLHDFVDEALDYGENYMTSIVPRGSTHRLAEAITRTGPVSPAFGHHIGSIMVDPLIAPYAHFVDRGTGVDGPYKTPSIVMRPSRTGRPDRGVHRFFKNGEEPRFRKVVKARPSAKIEHGKNFSGRTYQAMRDWLRIRTGVLANRLAKYFADPSRPM